MKKKIAVTVMYEADYPDDWSDEMIEFHLNESSWCFSNFLDYLIEYEEKHGCICGLCKAEVSTNDANSYK